MTYDFIISFLENQMINSQSSMYFMYLFAHIYIYIRCLNGYGEKCVGSYTWANDIGCDDCQERVHRQNKIRIKSD